MVKLNTKTGRFEAFTPYNMGRKIGSFDTLAEAWTAIELTADRERKKAARYWKALNVAMAAAPL